MNRPHGSSAVVNIYPSPGAASAILRRAPWEDQLLPESLLDGIERIFGERLTAAEAVARLLSDVRRRGDTALREWSQRIDGAGSPSQQELSNSDIEVPPAAWAEAYRRLAPHVRAALDLAAERIERFHRLQPVGSWVDAGPEGTLGQLIRPIDRAGVYVPGGSAPLPSSLLMAAIPARAAGVREVVACTPPGLGTVPPLILAAAYCAGIDRLFALGGALAVAAMAYGTETVPAVDKIVGAGGLFVTLAKRQVVGAVGIDGFYGPTETLLIADETADPAWAAADLLAQAEHDILASPILVTPSLRLAQDVAAQVAAQLEGLSRAEIAAQALAARGGIILVNDLEEAVEVANAYAPEHLCLLVADPWVLVGRIRNAGGIFLGEGSFEVLGDYVAGPSHVMPTEGSARYASPLSVADFVKRISLVALAPHAVGRLSEHAAVLAEGEGLTAHAAAAALRVRASSSTPSRSIPTATGSDQRGWSDASGRGTEGAGDPDLRHSK